MEIALIVSTIRHHWHNYLIAQGLRAPVLPGGVIPEPDPAPVITPRRRRIIGADNGFSTRWHFRSTILDHLDEYFDCLEHMRRADADNYAYFSKVGFVVTGQAYMNPEYDGYRSLLATRPRVSQGGILFAIRDVALNNLDADRVYPSFIYFSRFRKPINVPIAGVTPEDAIYRVNVVFDDRARRRMNQRAAHFFYHVKLTPQGDVALLREWEARIATTVLRPNRKRKRPVTLTRKQWTYAYPEWVCRWAAEHKDDNTNRNKGVTPESLTCDMFRMAFLTYHDSLDRLIIRAERRGAVAAFGIDLSRAKYFFADRHIEAAADGRRRRIFHSVTTHTRRLSTGTTTMVRTHYRGARVFDWNACRIQIVLPTNNVFMTGLDIAAEDRHAAQDYDPGLIGNERFGALVAAQVGGGVGTEKN